MCTFTHGIGYNIETEQKMALETTVLVKSSTVSFPLFYLQVAVAMAYLKTKKFDF
jgi:hypothetical protein